MGITCGLQVWAHRVTKALRGFSATENDNDYMSLLYAGWGTWIRTKTSGVRVRCSTLKLFPSRRAAREGRRSGGLIALHRGDGNPPCGVFPGRISVAVFGRRFCGFRGG